VRAVAEKLDAKTPPKKKDLSARVISRRLRRYCIRI
jgi:hypothetical protein